MVLARAMSFIETPRNLPYLTEWSAPTMDGLATPSLTATALARAHESLQAALRRRDEALHAHDGELHSFVADAVHIDDTVFGG